MRKTLLGVAFLCTQCVSANPLPENQLFVADAQLSLISTDLIHNGQAMQVFRVNSSKTVASLLETYRQHWESGAFAQQVVPLQRIAQWHVISRFAPRYQLVLQLRPDAIGSTGFLSIMNIADGVKRSSAQTRDEQSLLPASTLVVSSTTTESSVEQSRTVVGTHSLKPGQLQAHWFQKLERRGWSKMQQIGSGRFVMALFNRREEKLDIGLIANNRNTTTLIATRYQSP